ncbi:hypothetical protein [Eubacterium aggregans]|uniref:hypothetical protein n=1 Tax=Eubacterium aggregans TaxID=81409 RepID=UPI003F2D6FC0
MLNTLTQKILKGGQVTRQEASTLSQVPLNDLAAAATQLRKHFCGNTFDLCTIREAIALKTVNFVPNPAITKPVQKSIPF